MGANLLRSSLLVTFLTGPSYAMRFWTRILELDLGNRGPSFWGPVVQCSGSLSAQAHAQAFEHLQIYNKMQKQAYTMQTNPSRTVSIYYTAGRSGGRSGRMGLSVLF